MTVEFLVFDTLCELVWRPFSPLVSSQQLESAALLQAVAERIQTQRSPRAATAWRALTECGLQSAGAQEKGFQSVVDRILTLLSPFRTDSESDVLSTMALDIVTKAAEVWAKAESDTRPLKLCHSPDPADINGWIREDNDFYAAEEQMTSSQHRGQSFTPTRIFPKIIRVSQDGESVITVCKGRAILNDSPILTLGHQEKVNWQNHMEDAKRNYASYKSFESSAPLARNERRFSSVAETVALQGLARNRSATMKT